MVHSARLGLAVGAVGAGAVIVGAALLAPEVDLLPPGPEVGEAAVSAWPQFPAGSIAALPSLPAAVVRPPEVPALTAGHVGPLDLEAELLRMEPPVPWDVANGTPPSVGLPPPRPEIGLVLELPPGL